MHIAATPPVVAAISFSPSDLARSLDFPIPLQRLLSDMAISSGVKPGETYMYGRKARIVMELPCAVFLHCMFVFAALPLFEPPREWPLTAQARFYSSA